VSGIPAVFRSLGLCQNDFVSDLHSRSRRGSQEGSIYNLPKSIELFFQHNTSIEQFTGKPACSQSSEFGNSVLAQDFGPISCVKSSWLASVRSGILSERLVIWLRSVGGQLDKFEMGHDGHCYSLRKRKLNYAGPNWGEIAGRYFLVSTAAK
jgi:hypothetical protein